MYEYFYLQSNRSEWQIVFAIAAVVFFVGNLIYIIFGSTMAQPWDAEDFLQPKDAESSKSHADDNISGTNSVGQMKALEAKQSHTNSESNKND